jgi:hypothetical protein
VPLLARGAAERPCRHTHALRAWRAFTDAYRAKWPKAVAKITDDLDMLLAFYDYPPSTGSTYGSRN